MQLTILRLYLGNCRPYESFKRDNTILATRTNGRLGNQMSAFATLYAGAQIARNKLRVGLNYVQLQILEKAFPYFKSNFNQYLMDSWYCLNPKSFDWNTMGKKCTTQKLVLMIQGDPNRNFSFKMALFLKPYIFDPMLVKSKTV